MLFWILGLIALYAVAIPFSRWCETQDSCHEEDRILWSMYEKAAHNMPSLAPLFRFFDRMHDLILAPLSLAAVIIALPFIVIWALIETIRETSWSYCDPCFHPVPAPALSSRRITELDRLEQELAKIGFLSLGTYKYKNVGLRKIVRYFSDDSGQTIAAVYSVDDRFEVFFATLFADGSCVGTTGVDDGFMSTLKDTDKRGANCWLSIHPETSPRRLLAQHRAGCCRWISERATRAHFVASALWKPAFIFIERLAAHLAVERGKSDFKNIPPAEFPLLPALSAA